MLTRQRNCIGRGGRLADVVVAGWENRNVCSGDPGRHPFGELRRQARRERDGRVSARLIAIANALDGMDRASAARLAGMDRQTLRDWCTAQR